jgi:hypothetical protein
MLWHAFLFLGLDWSRGRPKKKAVYSVIFVKNFISFRRMWREVRTTKLYYIRVRVMQDMMRLSLHGIHDDGTDKLHHGTHCGMHKRRVLFDVDRKAVG